MCKVIGLCSAKGGTAKTTSTINMGVGLSRKGYKVLVVDIDPQGSLTAALGWQEPDLLEEKTLAYYMERVINDKDIQFEPMHTEEGVDLIPGNIELSGIDASLANVMCREQILRAVINEIKEKYDYIILDSLPSLGLLAINVMVAADSIIIPIQTAFLSTKALEQLIKTYGKVRRVLNPDLSLDGILFTMVNDRTNNAKEISKAVRETYGKKIRIFETFIPKSVKAEEASANGMSIYRYDGKCKVAEAYRAFTEEYLRGVQ